MYFVVSVVICLPSQKPYHGKGEELASCVPSNCLPALPASADGPRCGLQIQHFPFCTYWPWLCDWLWKLTEWYLSLINWETTSKISSGNGNGMGGRMGVGRSQEWWCWPWETWSYEGEEPGSKQKKPFPKGNGGQNTERADRPEVRDPCGTCPGCDASQVRTSRCPWGLVPFPPDGVEQHHGAW